MAISNEQLTRNQNTCSRPFSFVPSLAVQCLGVQCRLRHSPSDRYIDCSKRLCLPLHPQRPVCLEFKYYLSKVFFFKRKAFKNIHWAYSFNLRNVITPVNTCEIEICERALDWKAIVKYWKWNSKECVLSFGTSRHCCIKSRFTWHGRRLVSQN